MTVLPQIAEIEGDLVALYEDLHAHPELGFEESRTAGIVAERLRAMGVDEVHEGIGGTGVVGLIRGKGGGNRCVGLRADMDALPIDEASGVAFSSTTPGVMHACGHDGHTTMLLGAAQYLCATRDFDGTAMVVFQPAEEGLGGARAMLEDGLFERFPCDEIYGMHNQPGGQPGTANIVPGPAMAGAEFFDIKIIGKGSHVAAPHLGRDPVVIASALVQQLQSIVSRNLPPLEACVLSITQIHAGNAYNVVPQEAALAGTLRYFSRAVRDTAVARMQALCDGMAAAYEVEITLDSRPTFDVLDNDPALSAEYLAAAADIVGAENVRDDMPPVMGSEDFSDMLRVVPGAYIRVGHTGTAMLHNPAFVLGKEILPVGASIMARIVERRLPLGA